MPSARYQAHWAASQRYAASCRTTCPTAGNGKSDKPLRSTTLTARRVEFPTSAEVASQFRLPVPPHALVGDRVLNAAIEPTRLDMMNLFGLCNETGEVPLPRAILAAMAEDEARSEQAAKLHEARAARMRRRAQQKKRTQH